MISWAKRIARRDNSGSSKSKKNDQFLIFWSISDTSSIFYVREIQSARYEIVPNGYYKP